jgi:DNA modification methylase
LILNNDLFCENPLPELERESIQLIITSPPYFIVRDYNSKDPFKIKFKNNKQDLIAHYNYYLKDLDHVINNLIPLVKKGGVIAFVVGDVFVNGFHFPLPFNIFNILSKYFVWGETIIWDKTDVINFKSRSSKRAIKYLNQPVPFNYQPNFSHEYILIFKKSGINLVKNFPENRFSREIFIKNYSRSIWRIEPVPPSLLNQHPARFPFEIPRNLIKFYSNKTDIVFDPFAGYGTTLIESLNLGRKGIANDKEKRYFELMKKNIEIINRDPEFFSNQLNQHRINAHIRDLRRKNIRNEEIYDYLLNLGFEQEIINKSFF